MNFSKITLIILSISFCAQGFSEEEVVSTPVSIISDEKFETNPNPPPFPISKEGSAVITNKTVLYGSLCIAPGAGISIRERRQSKGNALDCKAGLLPFSFDAVGYFPVLSVDYNYLYYTRNTESSPYFSYGLGAAYFVPYVPLRAGYEFKHGFIDVGAKMVMGFIPSPELRAGINLKF